MAAETICPIARCGQLGRRKWVDSIESPMKLAWKNFYEHTRQCNERVEMNVEDQT